MATTKNTQTSKKSSSTTKAKNAKSTARPWSWRFSVLTIGIYTIAVVTVVLAAFFISNKVTAQQNDARLSKIQGIYSSLSIGDSYEVTKVNVFGDKRVYVYDKGRSFSSEIDYLHADTVSNTVADLDGKIKSAGFSFVDEPYPGSGSTQYHYKSAKGEYIRLTVSSKPYDDAYTNALLMDKDSVGALYQTFDKNAGPSNVIIKVNLDDNNE